MPVDLLICVGCGDRAEHPVVDANSGPPLLVCRRCGHRQPFLRLPLFALTGPSGTGKSTVCRLLAAELRDRVVVLEQDVLWTAALQDPAGDFRLFRATWLRMVGMIHQSGRPVLLCGTVVPVQFEQCPERALVGDIHYLGLVCDPDVMRARLLARPGWRGWDEARVAEMLDFDAWLRRSAPAMDPPLPLVDTTTAPVTDTVDTVAAWVHSKLR